MGLCVACLLRETIEGGAESRTVAAPELGTALRYFGNYELIREIGRGGMGVVYEASQQNLNRRVALKVVLAGEFASEADMRRFRDEAGILARLEHPHIVPFFEVGEHEGRNYYTMKLRQAAVSSSASRSWCRVRVKAPRS